MFRIVVSGCSFTSMLNREFKVECGYLRVENGMVVYCYPHNLHCSSLFADIDKLGVPGATVKVDAEERRNDEACKREHIEDRLRPRA